MDLKRKLINSAHTTKEMIKTVMDIGKKVTIGFHGGWFSQEGYVVNLRLEDTNFGYNTSNISVGLLEKIVAEMHDYENEIQEKIKQ